MASDLELEGVRWYAVPNDEIGGWAIATKNVPTSQLRYGEWVVGDFLTERLAGYVAGLHNHLHKARFPEQWDDEGLPT